MNPTSGSKRAELVAEVTGPRVELEKDAKDA